MGSSFVLNVLDLWNLTYHYPFIPSLNKMAWELTQIVVELAFLPSRRSRRSLSASTWTTAMMSEWTPNGSIVGMSLKGVTGPQVCSCNA